MKHRIIVGLICVASGLPGLARGDGPEPPHTQTVAPGDAHVQSHLPVAIVADPDVQRQTMSAVRALTAGAGSVAAEGPTTGATLEVVWRPGTRDERVIPLGPGAVLLPVTPHRTETYTYFVRLRDSKGQFEARWPASPALYRIEAEAASGPTVLDGTGDGQAAQGEMIPIQVRLADPSKVQDVVLFHRSVSAGEWTSSPMAIREHGESDATWSGSVQRPLGRDADLEYFVRATGRDGRVTHYGLADRPHRVHVVAPILPSEADQ